MRLFVALPLPPDLQQKLHRQMSTWPQRLPFRRWVHPQDLHITLQFIGESTPQQAQQLREALAVVVSNHQPLYLSITKLGTFGSSRQPRILWLGLGGELEQLSNLQAHLAETLTKEKLIDQQELHFTPHITIARNYQGEQPFSNTLLTEAALDPSLAEFSWMAEEIVVYQTHLGQQPMYEAITKLRLDG